MKTRYLALLSLTFMMTSGAAFALEVRETLVNTGGHRRVR